MKDIVTSFGAWIQTLCDKDPEKARQWLTTGYRAKKMQLRFVPGRGMTRSAQMAAVQTMDSMIAPLAHPDKAAMVRDRAMGGPNSWWPRPRWPGDRPGQVA